MRGRLAARKSGAAVVMTLPEKLRLSSLAAVLVLSACSTVPTAPTVPVLPGTGKSLDQFRTDDGACQQYALAHVGGKTVSQAATASAQSSASEMQRRYDLGYIQCMYFKGHRVPVLGPMTAQPQHGSSPPPPPSPGTAEFPAPPAAPR